MLQPGLRQGVLDGSEDPSCPCCQGLHKVDCWLLLLLLPLVVAPQQKYSESLPAARHAGCLSQARCRRRRAANRPIAAPIAPCRLAELCTPVTLGCQKPHMCTLPGHQPAAACTASETPYSSWVGSGSLLQPVSGTAGSCSLCWRQSDQAGAKRGHIQCSTSPQPTVPADSATSNAPQSQPLLTCLANTPALTTLLA